MSKKRKAKYTETIHQLNKLPVLMKIWEMIGKNLVSCNNPKNLFSLTRSTCCGMRCLSHCCAGFAFESFWLTVSLYLRVPAWERREGKRKEELYINNLITMMSI